MEQRSSPTNKLTIELLVKILNYVKYVGSTGSLYSCLRCCRQWRDLGLPFLYEGIALVNKDTTKKFCRDRSLFSRKLDLLDSLTIGLESIPFEEKGPEMFAAILGRLSNLRTLSIVSVYYTSAAATLLRALPQTVENLEVNFGKKCRASHLEEHLCDEIRPHLKTVKRLRMRHIRVCASLFVKSDSWLSNENITPLALHSVVVTSWQDEPFRWCYSEDEAANMLNVVCGKAFYLLGVLPHCKEIHYIWVTKSKDGQDGGTGLQLLHFDILRNWQQTYSMIKMSKLLHGFSNFVIKARGERMLYGNENDLISHVEGELGFLKTSLGLRFPAAVSLKRDYCMKKSSLKYVDDIIEDQSSPKSFCAALGDVDLPSIVQRETFLESFRFFPREFWALGQYMIEVCEKNKG